MLAIPLVIDTNGETLQYLRDSLAFLKTLPKDFKIPNELTSHSKDHRGQHNPSKGRRTRHDPSVVS
jgi:hypothetical protein